MATASRARRASAHDEPTVTRMSDAQLRRVGALPPKPRRRKGSGDPVEDEVRAAAAAGSPEAAELVAEWDADERKARAKGGRLGERAEARGRPWRESNRESGKSFLNGSARPSFSVPRRASVADGAGFALGILIYLLGVNYLRGGTPQVKKWLTAKFFNGTPRERLAPDQLRNPGDTTSRPLRPGDPGAHAFNVPPGWWDGVGGAPK